MEGNTNDADACLSGAWPVSRKPKPLRGLYHSGRRERPASVISYGKNPPLDFSCEKI